MLDNRSMSHNEKIFKASPAVLQLSVLFISVLFLIAYRQPAILNEPRFWAEEGACFFSYAFSHGWLDTLLYVGPHLGYYTLAQNLAALLATSIPLEQAPVVTTFIGFFSHLLPCCVVIAGNSPFWNTVPKKILICLGILFFPFGRIWLNTTYIHFTLALCVLLILLTEMKHHNRLTINLFRSLLVFGGLSGALSCFLTPLFVFKAWRSRQKEEIVQASLIVIASFVQAAIIVYSYSRIDAGTQSRFVSLGSEQLWSIVFFQFGVPFFGYPYFESALINNLNISLSWMFIKDPLSLFSVLLVILYTCFVLVRQIRDKQIRLPAIAFILMFGLSTAGSIGMKGGSRYAYVPCVIFLIMLIAEICHKNSGIIRKGAAAFFIILMLLINGYGYRKGTEIYPYKWSEEIRKWRIYNNYKPKIWPDGWEMTLDPVKSN